MDISDVHVIEIKGGTPLGDPPESSTPAWASGTLPSAISGRLRPHSIYTCIKAHTCSRRKDARMKDGENWVYAVTERWRAFDLYRSLSRCRRRVASCLRPFALIDAIDLQGCAPTP